MRGVGCALLVFALFTSASSAQSVGNAGNRRGTTGEVARCADAADQPICLLKIGAKLSPASERSEFVEFPDIARQVDAGIQRPEPVSDAYEAASTKPRRDAARLAREAIAADRRGVPAAEALKPIEVLGEGLASRSFVGGQIITPSGGDFRNLAYSSISDAYQAGLKNPKLGAPSKALVDAALVRWEAELAKAAPVRGPGYEELAQTYLTLGDEAALGRIEQRDRRAVFAARVWDAKKRDDVESLARLVLKWPPDQRDRIFYETRQTVLNAASSVRAELARPIIDEAIKDSPASAIGALAKVDRAAAATRIQQLDLSGRDVSKPASAFAAAAAVRGWVALGQRDRAAMLLALWIPFAKAEIGKSCGPCVTEPVMWMLSDTNRIEEGWKIGIARMSKVIELDIAEGRGVSKIERYFELETVQFEREYGLQDCVYKSAVLGKLSDSEACMRLMVARVGHRSLSEFEITSDQSRRTFGSPIGGPYRTLSTTLYLAGAYAEKDDMQSAQRWLDEAFRIAKAYPDENLEVNDTAWTDRIALGQLRAQGRM